MSFIRQSHKWFTWWNKCILCIYPQHRDWILIWVLLKRNFNLSTIHYQYSALGSKASKPGAQGVVMLPTEALNDSQPHLGQINLWNRINTDIDNIHSKEMEHFDKIGTQVNSNQWWLVHNSVHRQYGMKILSNTSKGSVHHLTTSMDRNAMIAEEFSHGHINHGLPQ